MKLKTLSALILASTLFTAACEEADQKQGKVDDILLRAESYFNQGQYSAANIEARNAIKEDARSVDAYLLLARIFTEQGNYAQSIHVLKDLPQNNVEVVELLGNNYLRQSKLKSLNQLLESVASNPETKNSWELKRLQAIALVQLGKQDQALKHIDNLMATATTQDQKAEAEIVRSYYFGKNKDATRQLQALDQALNFAPNSVDALLAKAKYHYAEKNYEAAEDLLSQALIALPRTDVMTLRRLEVLQAMASTLSKQNRSGEAMIYSKLISEANPKAQELQNEFEEGVEKLQAGDLKSAEEVFSKLYVTDHAKLAGSVLGLIKFQQGDYKEAAEFFQDTIDPETASPEILRAFAESQLRMRNPEQALKTIEANVQEHPNNPDILSVYGLALLSTGNTAKGIETVNRALQLDPSRANLHMALANAYNVQNQPEKATLEAEKAYATNKTDLSIQERLAMQYAMTGKANELTRFARELSQSASIESQALGGLILLRTEPKTGTKILDDLYAKSPSEPSVLRAQLRKNLLARDTAQVIRIGKLLVQQDANDIATLNAIAQSYVRQNQPDQASAYLQELAEQSASTWGPDYVLAAQALIARDFQGATNHINKAVTKSSYNQVTTSLYAQIYLANAANQAQAGNFAQAREIIMEAMQNNEVSPPLLHLLIRVELADKHIPEAEKLAAELQQSAAGSQITNHALGDIAAAKGDKNAALTHYQSAWSTKPSDALAGDIWKLMGDASDQKKDDFLTNWQQKLPRSIAAKNIAGMRYQERGDAKGAIKTYEDSLALNQRQPVILNNLAWLLMEANRTSEAFTHAEKAVQLAGNNPSILDTFGWIAFKAGRKDVALANLEKALALQPDNSDIKAHLQAVKGK